MKKYQILLFLFALCSFSKLTAQDTKSVDSLRYKIIYPYKLQTDPRDEKELRSWLHIKKHFISLKCHTLINSIEYEDYKTDSTDYIELINAESFIYLKYSYHWNLKDELPKLPKMFVIKSLLKRKSKMTDDDWKILKYKEFHSIEDKKLRPLLIDKFVHIQILEVNNSDQFKVKYIFKYNQTGSLEISSKTVEKL